MTFTGDYITQTGATSGDLTNALGNALVAQLWSDESGSVSQDAIDDSIRRGQSRINATLVGVYALPISTGASTAYEILRSINTDFAVFYGYARHPEFTRQDGRNPHVEAFKAADAMLDKLRSGDMMLDAESAQKPSVVGGTLFASASTFIVESDEGVAGPSGGY